MNSLLLAICIRKARIIIVQHRTNPRQREASKCIARAVHRQYPIVHKLRSGCQWRSSGKHSVLIFILGMTVWSCLLYSVALHPRYGETHELSNC